MEVSYVIYLSAILFLIGAIGVISRRNMFNIFISVEIMLNAVNLSFVGFAYQNGNVDGIVMAIFIIALAAAGAAFGFAIIISLYKRKEILDVDSFRQIKG